MDSMVQTNVIMREQKTVALMIRLYCKNKHGSNKILCRSCNELSRYTVLRLSKCPFKKNKPQCKNCKIHCYEKRKRSQIKNVMRFAGPRMMVYHPILAIRHLMT